MKRFLCFTLALLLLIPVLLLPAAAAERKEYVFEYVEPVVTYSNDYEFSDFASNRLFCPEIPADGVYRLSFVYGGVTYTTFPFELIAPTVINDYVWISFGDWDEQIWDPPYPDYTKDLGMWFECCSEYTMGYPFCFGVFSFDSDGFPSSHAFFHVRDFLDVKLISYDPIFDSLTGAFSFDPHALLTHVLSLLPIVLPVVVGFIGIRKAVAWLRSKLSEA